MHLEEIARFYKKKARIIIIEKNKQINFSNKVPDLQKHVNVIEQIE